MGRDVEVSRRGGAGRDVGFSVLVNSCDAFEDCWSPFFSLFSRYWPECDVPIYLNTENKVFESALVPVVSTTVQSGGESRLTWSECLLRALEQVETPFVLYMQEDYFLHRRVRDDVVRAAVTHMSDHQEVGHVALTCHGSHGPYEPYGDGGFKLIGRRAAYRISTQVGLWRTDVLRSYLRSEENGWMFEVFGTWRAWKREDVFLVANFDGRVGGAAFDYLHTGIIKGKWLPDIVEVFRRNELEVDFSRRGFYERQGGLSRRFALLKRLVANPVAIIRALLG